jgi:hypothetical protein
MPCFGASVGIIAGRTVTRHGREFPVVVTPVAGGVAVLYSPIGQRALIAVDSFTRWRRRAR